MSEMDREFRIAAQYIDELPDDNWSFAIAQLSVIVHMQERRITALEAAQKPKPAQGQSDNLVAIINTIASIREGMIATIKTASHINTFRESLIFNAGRLQDLLTEINDSMLPEIQPAGPEWPASLEEEATPCRCCGQCGPCDCRMVAPNLPHIHCLIHSKEM